MHERNRIETVLILFFFFILGGPLLNLIQSKAYIHLHHTRLHTETVLLFSLISLSMWCCWCIYTRQTPPHSSTHIYTIKTSCCFSLILWIPESSFRFLSFVKNFQCPNYSNMEGKKPYLVVILIQVIYAGMVLFMKAAFDGGMNSFVFVFYRQAAATVLLIPLALYFEW